MKIFPAIDIEDGHCVRLKQGKIQDLTVYGDDPVKMALKWESLGPNTSTSSTLMALSKEMA